MDVHKEARVPTDPTPRVFDLNINLSELRQILSKTTFHNAISRSHCVEFQT